MNFLNTIRFVFLGLLLQAFALSASANEKDDAVKMVNDAAAYVQQHGKDKAVADINAGKFVKGEIYVFAYDLNAVMLAHPKNAKLIGKNLMDTPDAEGKMFRKEIIEMAKSKGNGWVDYMYKNPETSKIEPKTTYLKKVGEMVLCAGVYK